MSLGKRHETKYLYEFGAFRLDPAERVFTRMGQRIPLAPKAFDTRLILVQRHGHGIDEGIPEHIRCDNGPEFSARRAAELVGASRNQDAVQRTWQSMGERILRELQREVTGRALERGDFLGEDCERSCRVSVRGIFHREHIRAVT